MFQASSLHLFLLVSIPETCHGISEVIRGRPLHGLWGLENHTG